MISGLGGIRGNLEGDVYACPAVTAAGFLPVTFNYRKMYPATPVLKILYTCIMK